MANMAAVAGTEQATDLISMEEYGEICRFLYKEARLADESRYTEWESLVDEDMIYWVPRGEGDYDMTKHVSITADNRARLRTRIAQLATGKHHTQVPVSFMRRVVSNIEIERSGKDSYRVLSNFVLYELRRASTGKLEVWPGRAEHHIRRRPDGSLGMFFKKVVLVHGDEAVASMAFII